MKTHQTHWPLHVLARLLEVSLSGFYAWLTRKPSQREVERRQATIHVKVAHQQNKGQYGHLRTYHYLKRQGIGLSAYLVRCIRQTEGLQCKVKRKRCITTDSRHGLPFYDNVLDRDFQRSHINQAWCCDITYINTQEGWLYLAGVKDLYSKEIVGYSFGERMTADLVISALRMAINRKQPPQGLIVHSERGSQYCSQAHRELIEKHGFIGSMSRKRECHDNAPIESFWSRLKAEQQPKEQYQSKQDAKEAIKHYIEIIYNRQRIQAGLSYHTPAEVAENRGMGNAA